MSMRFDLRAWLNPVFVETGTWKGDGVRRALKAGFERVISLEVHDPTFEAARAQFAGEPRVELVRGDSQHILADIVAPIAAPVTFWLDAHVMGEARGEKSCPLYDELDGLAAARGGRRADVVLVDDRRLFGRENGPWGGDIDEDEVAERLRAIDPAFVIDYLDGFVERDVIAAFRPEDFPRPI
ncbi:MAG: hypothetical protein MI723_09260 [Caulobacterales bacterium]|nr:hypothetical protein [Caulobacterales bacterium]